MWGECRSSLALTAYHQGKFALGADLWGEVYSAARRNDNTLQEAWGLEGQGENLLRLGRISEVITLLNATIALLAKNSDRPTEIQTYGVLALASLRQGQPQAALQAAEKATQLIAQTSPSLFYTFEGYAGATEAYLGLWEANSGRGDSEQKRLTQSARRACKTLRGFARAFPIGQPRYWLCQGLYSWLSGKPRRAHQAWQKSLAHAEKLAMPYEQGLAHYEIGRHLPLDDPTGRDHLSQARDIFTRLDANYDLRRAQQALLAGEP